ncbi:MAG TPA: phosphatase PAP2 family protein [Sphingomicrobium sp.]|jgi:undecaprenyl-diphosphatase
MTSERNLSWTHVGAIVVLAALWLSMLLLGTGSVDQTIYRAMYVGGDPVLVGIARFFTELGEPTFLIAAGVACWLWLWYAGRARLGLVLLAIALLGRGLSQIQKYWFGRPRPDLNEHLVLVKTQSFPSGHANSSMIFFLTLALALAGGTKWARPAAVAAILTSLCVGTSRVMLGVHWPSDVIGGWSFGLLWVLLTLRPAERLFAGPRVSAPKR